MPFIFDRFYRGDSARQTSGTGLGLSIVAQTISQHGGWVKAGRSAQGGAEFTIQLPGAASLEALTEPAAQTHSPPVVTPSTAPVSPNPSTSPHSGPPLAESGRKRQT
jgi:hypothetical protein